MSKKIYFASILIIIMEVLFFVGCSLNNPFFQYDFSQPLTTTTTLDAYVSSTTTSVSTTIDTIETTTTATEGAPTSTTTIDETTTTTTDAYVSTTTTTNTDVSTTLDTSSTSTSIHVESTTITATDTYVSTSTTNEDVSTTLDMTTTTVALTTTTTFETTTTGAPTTTTIASSTSTSATTYVSTTTTSTSTTTTTIADAIPPADPLISINPITPTSGDVTVTITFSGDSAVKHYKIGTNSYQSYTAPFTVSENIIIYAKAQDAVGNWSGEVSYSITNIDKIAPTATVAYSATAPTNGDVKATITPSESVTVTNNDGLTTRIFTENGSFTFEFTDVAGNTGSATATVGNIDKTAPTATVAYSTTAPTNGDVTATVTPSESVTITNNSGLTTYEFTANGSFTFNFTDAAGNTGSATATVANIDKTAPLDPSISINPTTPTSGDVTVTITFSGDSAVKQYKIGTGSYQSYTAPFTVSEDTTIYAKAQDAVGNWSGEVSYSITNIDKEAPVISTFTRTSDASSDSSIITFNLSGTDNVGITGWFMSKSSTTPLISDAGWIADKPVSFDIGSGSTAGIYTVYIWAKDAAGNISGVKSISFEFYIVSLAGYVKDSANNVIYGALIRLYNNNYSFLTSSGITGYYEFHNIPSGTYYLVAVRDGYTLETKIAVIP